MALPGQAATALGALARAYAIVTTSNTTAAASAATEAITPTSRSANQYWKVEVWDHDHIGRDDYVDETIASVDNFNT
ncbi:hypothetical protein ACLMAL_38810 [Nocardia sp. CWNU-33]|uniref:hypothetical protein n=1 Tax=Nocardia sp. CWNU-33 TaxID=3392117 RepID=UPI00398F2048